MCLAVPMKVVEIHGDTGVVETGGVRQDAGFQLLEGVKNGDYVIVHAGFAIQRLDEAEALETLALFKGLEKAS